MRCSVHGLGKVGAPLAAVIARAGLEVVGVDLDERLVRDVGAGRAPFAEPGLDEALRATAGRLTTTLDQRQGVAASDVSFVIVPTPSDRAGRFSNDAVIAAVEGIGRALREIDEYHVVVVTSTVMPGSTGGVIRSALERASGRRVGPDVGLCYSPRFIALGSVLRDLEHPDIVLIGESDERAGDVVETVYRRTCRSNPKLHRMSWVNAEIAKLAVNTFVTTKISFANMLAEVCEGFQGADVEVVTAAVGDDSRIGRKYLRGATSYGGPCFPRDNVALTRAAEEAGVDATLARATDDVNRRQATRLSDLVVRHLLPGGTVAILGLAYKPETPVTEASAGCQLAQELLRRGVRVVVYDPVATLSNAMDGATEASSLKASLDQADVAVIATPWPEFARIPAELAGSNRSVTVIDCWRQLDESDLPVSTKVVRLGRGLPEPA